MNINIFDTTLRDGEQAPGNTLGANNKLNFAFKLQELGVDVIEAGFPANKKHDFKAVKLIADNIKTTTISALARLKKSDIDICILALKNAKRSLLHIFYPTSEQHLKTKFGISEEKSLDIISEQLKYACSIHKNILFSLEDATRSNRSHILKVIQIAHDLGINKIGIADTVGFALPDEMFSLVKLIKQKFPSIFLSVHCHNDLGLATANTLASIEAGADEVQVTINGIGERAGNTALEEIALTLKTRFDFYKSRTNLDISKIYKVSSFLYDLLGRVPSFEKAIVGKNSFRHESGIHVSALLKNKKTYEIINPNSIGRHTDFVFGVHSGGEQKYDKIK